MRQERIQQRARMSGFTLIEIMVVIIIIGILAAVIAPTVIGKVDVAQVAKVRADIKSIETALGLYRLDNFSYPTTEQGLQALVANPNDPTVKNWNPGGYIKTLQKDPWRNDYLYLNPGTHGNIDIYSFGLDGRPGGEGLNADLGNWDID